MRNRYSHPELIRRLASMIAIFCLLTVPAAILGQARRTAPSGPKNPPSDAAQNQSKPQLIPGIRQAQDALQHVDTELAENMQDQKKLLLHVSTLGLDEIAKGADSTVKTVVELLKANLNAQLAIEQYKDKEDIESLKSFKDTMISELKLSVADAYADKVGKIKDALDAVLDAAAAHEKLTDSDLAAFVEKSGEAAMDLMNVLTEKGTLAGMAVDLAKSTYEAKILLDQMSSLASDKQRLQKSIESLKTKANLPEPFKPAKGNIDQLANGTEKLLKDWAARKDVDLAAFKAQALKHASDHIGPNAARAMAQQLIIVAPEASIKILNGITGFNPDWIEGLRRTVLLTQMSRNATTLGELSHYWLLIYQTEYYPDGGLIPMFGKGKGLPPFVLPNMSVAQIVQATAASIKSVTVETRPGGGYDSTEPEIQAFPIKYTNPIFAEQEPAGRLMVVWNGEHEAPLSIWPKGTKKPEHAIESVYPKGSALAQQYPFSSPRVPGEYNVEVAFDGTPNVQTINARPGQLVTVTPHFGRVVVTSPSISNQTNWEPYFLSKATWESRRNYANSRDGRTIWMHGLPVLGDDLRYPAKSGKVVKTIETEFAPGEYILKVCLRGGDAYSPMPPSIPFTVTVGNTTTISLPTSTLNVDVKALGRNAWMRSFQIFDPNTGRIYQNSDQGICPISTAGTGNFTLVLLPGTYSIKDKDPKSNSKPFTFQLRAGETAKLKVTVAGFQLVK